ncbi:hypothetical protein NQZ68_005985 [Dissostichus eleginoides]|nr:hypothetical protein NQZ68_005985 [Dissostichus eleginoides]
MVGFRLCFCCDDAFLYSCDRNKCINKIIHYAISTEALKFISSASSVLFYMQHGSKKELTMLLSAVSSNVTHWKRKAVQFFCSKPDRKLYGFQLGMVPG